jgi:hypothetical protein
MDTGFFTARRVLPPSNSAISFSIPSRERQFVFSNAKGAASAFGTNKAAATVGRLHYESYVCPLTAGVLVQD